MHNKLNIFIFIVLVFNTLLFSGENAKDLLYNSTERWDITFQDTDNNNLSYEKILQEVEKVAKEVDKVNVLLPRVMQLGSCGNTGCTLDSVQCDAVTEDPICPDGSVLNGDRDMCQKDPDVFNCPAGFTYDSTVGQCVKPVECPYGGTYVIERQRCESPILYDCPNGYTEENGVCVSPPLCQAGGIFNPVNNMCEVEIIRECASGWSWNSSVQICERDPSCVAGTTYSTTLNTCISNFSRSCASGYSFNSARDRCEKNPVCPVGTTYNSSANRCEQGADSACNGGTWNGSQCVEVVGANYPATLSSNITRCAYTKRSGFAFADVSPVLYANVGTRKNVRLGTLPLCLPTGKFVKRDTISYLPQVFWIFARSVYFFQEPVSSTTTYTCPNGGTLSGTTCLNQTTSLTSPSCPTGYTHDGSGGCYQNPTCPSGGQFDGDADKCYLNYSKTCDIGTYDSSSDKCIVAPDCFGGILEQSRDKCQQSKVITCSIGVLNQDKSKCIFDSDCIGSGGLNLSTKLCKDDKIPLACDEGTDTALDVCYEKQNECYVDNSFVNHSTLSYSNALKTCLVDEEIVCASLLTWSETLMKCEAVPICNYGVYNPENNFCFANDYSCPIDPNLECYGTVQFNHWCSPWKCNPNNECGYAYCLNGQETKDSAPWMSRTFFNDIQYIATSECINAQCDIVVNKDISYCGEDACPKGFGVYEEDNQCYQDTCPDGSILGDDGGCYIESCPDGTTEQGDGTCK